MPVSLLSRSTRLVMLLVVLLILVSAPSVLRTGIDLWSSPCCNREAQYLPLLSSSSLGTAFLPLPFYSSSHMSFERPPQLLHNFTVFPPSILSLPWFNCRTVASLVPSLYDKTFNTASPALHLRGDGQSFLSHKYAKHVSEQFLWFSPLVSSELPRLTSREHCDHT